MANKWYTPEVKKACKQVIKKSGVKVFFVEFDKGIAVVVDKNHDKEITESEKIYLAKYLLEVQEVIRSFKIPCRVEGFDFKA